MIQARGKVASLPDATVRQFVPLSRMARRLFIALGLLLAADTAFWFLVDFHKFHPSSKGLFVERAFFAGLTASGPFAYVINDHVSNAGMGVLIVGGIAGALAAVALRWRRFFVPRLLGYVGIAVWFMSGFSVAFLRIT